MIKPDNGYRPEPHYYSDRLRRKLNQIHSLPAVIIEATSGYGKTTAVRDFLEALKPYSTAVHWFTAVSEAPAVSFQRLCRVLHDIDSRAGQRLMKLGLPNAATVGEACAALRSIQCHQETYLTLDNFQYMQEVLPQAFQAALLDHGVKSLHLMLITQALPVGMHSDAICRGVMHITAADLRLNVEDVSRYSALLGMDISLENAGAVIRYTEGWMIAVYLALRALKDTGQICNTPDILLLMERLVLSSLTQEQQTFLLKLSLFEAVTARQACALLKVEALPEYALHALRSPFIRCLPREERYELHHILQEVLISKRKERGPSFERECLLGAGDLLSDEGALDRALLLYEQAGDVERMLKLDLSPLAFEDIGGEPFSAVALRITSRCPEDLKRRNPLSMLRLAWPLLAAGELKVFDDLLEAVSATLNGDGSEEGAWLRGEWLLLACWRQAPDLQAMLDLVKRAEPLFHGRCSRVILPGAPWYFGSISQVTAFHCVPGEADREACELEEFLKVYSRLTNGHGSGADALFRGEIAHYRGNLSEAEIFLHKAGYLAESCRQKVIQLGVALHLAEIAVEKADMEGWQRTIAAMERAASGQGDFALPSTVDMVRSLLFIELGHQKRITPWLEKGETEGLPPSIKGSALFIRLNHLMHEGEFLKLAGMAEAGLAMLRPADLLVETLISLQAGVGHLWTGNTARAQAFLRRAAEKSMSDGFVYLLAVYDPMLKGLPEKLIRAQYPERLTRFLEIKLRFLTGYTKLHSGIAAADLPLDLTAREREVALLAASGLRNGEIAKKLGVSENTVRAHLRAVYQKMDIDRRARLAEKLR